MNSDSVNEYILWLEEFREIYKDYIDSSIELEKIFAETLEKFHKILSGNNKNSTEENIITLLKELVKVFSVAYDANKNKNKSKKGPRNTDAFKQAIYETQIAKLKKWLIANINNTKLFPNFESIVMFVAKKRQMIEFLKLGQKSNTDYYVYFENYGKRRIQHENFRSPLEFSQAKHLYSKEDYKPKGIIYKPYQDIYLTFYISIEGKPYWYHTDAKYHPKLFEIMNELYSEFLSLVNGHNNTSKKDILPELYWLYMQTCPFKRGSAAIGEILFSVLLRKYFRCDFLISNGWNGDPLTIPDIHALHYELDHFKSIFWDQFTNCNLKKNSNNNNRINLQESRYSYYL